MEKIRLLEARKAKRFSQNQIAEMLCMDVSNYSRRENGQAKISISEWEKLSKILDVPLNDIYETDENQVFICKDNASINYQGTNHIYAVPEFLLETQQKYIRKLEEEIVKLKGLQGNK
jgi:transcriptional regulator with XRE-family HTH domain